MLRRCLCEPCRFQQTLGQRLPPQILQCIESGCPLCGLFACSFLQCRLCSSGGCFFCGSLCGCPECNGTRYDWESHIEHTETKFTTFVIRIDSFGKVVSGGDLLCWREQAVRWWELMVEKETRRRRLLTQHLLPVPHHYMLRRGSVDEKKRNHSAQASRGQDMPRRHARSSRECQYAMFDCALGWKPGRRDERHWHQRRLDSTLREKSVLFRTSIRHKLPECGNKTGQLVASSRLKHCALDVVTDVSTVVDAVLWTSSLVFLSKQGLTFRTEVFQKKYNVHKSGLSSAAWRGTSHKDMSSSLAVCACSWYHHLCVGVVLFHAEYQNLKVCPNVLVCARLLEWPLPSVARSMQQSRCRASFLYLRKNPACPMELLHKNNVVEFLGCCLRATAAASSEPRTHIAAKVTQYLETHSFFLKRNARSIELRLSNYWTYWNSATIALHLQLRSHLLLSSSLSNSPRPNWSCSFKRCCWTFTAPTTWPTAGDLKTSTVCLQQLVAGSATAAAQPHQGTWASVSTCSNHTRCRPLSWEKHASRCRWTFWTLSTASVAWSQSNSRFSLYKSVVLCSTKSFLESSGGIALHVMQWDRVSGETSGHVILRKIDPWGCVRGYCSSVCLFGPPNSSIATSGRSCALWTWTGVRYFGLKIRFWLCWWQLYVMYWAASVSKEKHVYVIILYSTLFFRLRCQESACSLAAWKHVQLRRVPHSKNVPDIVVRNGLSLAARTVWDHFFLASVKSAKHLVVRENAHNCTTKTIQKRKHEPCATPRRETHKGTKRSETGKTRRWTLRTGVAHQAHGFTELLTTFTTYVCRQNVQLITRMDADKVFTWKT